MHNLIKNRTGKFAAAILAFSLFIIAPLIQAEPVTTSASFDHARTGYLLRDIHTTLRCEQCHVDGIFKNTPRNCAGCHSLGTKVGALPKPANHLPTSQACDVCHKSPTNFLVKSFDHAGVSGACSTCHNGQSLGVVSKHAAHFPTGSPCELCHSSTSTFLSSKMDHTSIGSGCAYCHSGQFDATIVSKPAEPVYHVATNGLPCENCHDAKRFTDFGGASYNHDPVAVKNKCSTCHGVQPGVKMKSAAHFPTSAQCDTCHTQSNTTGFTSFGGVRYDHFSATTPSTNCVLCHSGGFTGATTKSGAHVQTTAQCSLCHNTTGNPSFNYTSFFGAKLHLFVITTGVCATCHNGVTAAGQLSLYPGRVSAEGTHIFTTGACDVCHKTTASFTTWTGANMDHSARVGACASCHNGSIATGKNPTHLATIAACDVCHTQLNTTNFMNFKGAVFTHTLPIGVCASCHNGTSATGMPPTHISVTNTACDVCHTQANTTNFLNFKGAVYNHPNPVGVCSTCHDGTNHGGITVTGKPVYHVPTTQACNSSGCHSQTNTSNYTTFMGVVYAHPTSPGVCSTCHNGVTAKGKSSTHVSTTAACDTCHTQTNTSNFATFLGATFAHATPPGVCATCHTGNPGKGKPVGHVATTAACDSCHTQTNTANYTTFLGAGFNHSPVPTTCQNCHNGATAIGKPSWHVVTTADCNACHFWSAGNPTAPALPATPTTFAGSAPVVVHPTTWANTCATGNCHNGTNAMGQSVGHIPVAKTMSCDSGGCHAIFNGTTVVNFTGGKMGHNVVTSMRCDACHNGTYTSQGTLGAYGKVTTHIPTTITTGLDCNTCHTTTVYTALSNWLTEKMNHNGAQGGAVGGNGVYCVNCHLKGLTYLGNMQKLSHNGASTAKDCSSTSCHKPLGKKGTAYSAWN